MANFAFNANDVAPDSGQLDPLAAGWYDMYVKTSEVKPTKDGTGTRLVLGFGFMNPQHKNRVVTVSLNVRNSSEQAQNIALGQLSALCHSVGILNMQDSAQLHNIPFKGKLKVIEADGPYAAKNEMAAYKHMQDPSVTGALNASVPGAPPAPTTRPLPPPASAHSPVPQVAQQAAPIPMAPPQAAPAPQAAPQQWAQPAAAQPWTQPAPPAQEAVQQAQPAWATAPVQQVAAAPAAQQHAAQPAVDTSVGGTVVPPWMQNVASANPPF